MRYLAFLLTLTFLGCGGLSQPPNPTPIVVDTDWCPAAEEHLKLLACKTKHGRLMGDPNQHGVPFQETCRATQEDNGIWLNPRCIAGAKSCDEVGACPQLKQALDGGAS